MTKTEFATLTGMSRQYVYDNISRGTIITDDDGLIIVSESLKNIMQSRANGYTNKKIELRINIPIEVASKLDSYAYDNKISISNAVKTILTKSDIFNNL